MKNSCEKNKTRFRLKFYIFYNTALCLPFFIYSFNQRYNYISCISFHLHKLLIPKFSFMKITDNLVIAQLVFCFIIQFQATAQSTRLLRQPAISTSQLAFEYGGDIWVTPKTGGEARRITSTAAVEGNPHFSPDGQWLAFNSNRSGIAQVYIVPAAGGTPARLTWYPAASIPRGWSPDGKQVLYASGNCISCIKR